MSARSIASCVLFLAAAWASSSVADVIVYDDASENALLESPEGTPILLLQGE